MNFTAKFVVSEHVREKKKRGKRVEAPQRGDCNNLVLAAALVPVVTDLNLDVQVMIGQDHCLCLEHTHTAGILPREQSIDVRESRLLPHPSPSSPNKLKTLLPH